MKKKLNVFSLLLAFVVLLCACGDSDSSSSVVESKKDSKPENFSYSVLVTINPELKLYLDSDDKVLAVECLNDDAVKAFSDGKYEGMFIDDCIERIVETAIDKEYLKDGKDVTITLDEVRDDNINGEIVLQKTEGSVKEVLTKKSFDAKVVTNKSDNLQPQETQTDLTDSTTSPDTQTTASTEESQTQSEATTTTKAEVEKCSHCNGSGECPHCNGGKNNCPACSGTGYATCPQCDENGLDHGEKCFACGGKHKSLCSHCKGGGKDIDCPTCKGTFKCTYCGGTGVEK